MTILTVLAISSVLSILSVFSVLAVAGQRAGASDFVDNSTDDSGVDVIKLLHGVAQILTRTASLRGNHDRAAGDGRNDGGIYDGTLFDPDDQKMRERYWVPVPPAEK